VDGTGVPAVPADTDGRAGKDPDGRAHTREVKLGVAFTQTSVDEQGFPIRNPHSSSYVATFEPVEHFGALVYAEARRRGSAKANEVVVLGDGAVWIWNLANLHFPGATHIVDLYHAREHLHDLGTLLAPVLGADRASCLADRSDELDAGDIPAILTAARALEVPAAKTDDLDKALGYFQNNAARMQYQTFSPSRPLRRLRRGRSQLQGRDRPTAQTVRDALERARRHRHRHPALPGSQRPLGRNLEAAPQPDQRGLTPPPTNLSHTHRVGPGLAADLYLTERLLDAEEARSAGLVARVAADAEVPLIAAEIAAQIASVTPAATRAAKEAIHQVSQPERASLVGRAAPTVMLADFHLAVRSFSTSDGRSA